MDIIAHLLWSYIFFHDFDNLILFLLAGTLPDFLSWGIYSIHAIFTKNIPRKKEDLDNVPEWTHTLYGITHSVFSFAIVFTLLLVLTKEVPFYLIGWILHILIDIPLHSKDLLPTPFLWPLSSYKFPGVSWGNKWLIIGNWLLLIGSLIIFF